MSAELRIKYKTPRERDGNISGGTGAVWQEEMPDPSTLYPGAEPAWSAAHGENPDFLPEMWSSLGCCEG